MVDYEIVRSGRRSICILIKDGEVVVRAPRLVPRFMIEKFVSEKSDWIEKKLRETKPKKSREYVESEQFMFFGKTYQLKIVRGNKDISLSGYQIIVSTHETDPKYLRKIIENYYLKLTREIVEKLLVKYAGEFEASGFKTVFKFYRSKWGSCSRNHLCFNGKLAMAPPEAIEYVVVHELCHIRHKNHSKTFWAEVEKYDPLYKAHRRWLNKNNHDFEL